MTTQCIRNICCIQLSNTADLAWYMALKILLHQPAKYYHREKIYAEKRGRGQ